MVALALSLVSRGHAVNLAGPPEWRSWAKSMGCPYTSLGRDLGPFLRRESAAHRLKAAASFRRWVLDEVVIQFERLPRWVAEADLVVGASLCLALPSVAEALAVPYRYVAFTPQLLPSGAHPCPIFRHQRRPPWINRLQWRLDALVQNLDLLPRLNRHRRRLGLPPVVEFWHHLLGSRLLLASDRELAAVPADVRLPVVQTGYLHLESASALPADLEAFISAGAKPLYAGFGSMPPADARRWVPLVVAAARANGRRLVLQADPAMVGRGDTLSSGETLSSREALSSGEALSLRESFSPDADLFVRAAFPHTTLFPRMRAVIHHGGAGTTAMAARSGVPQIVVPHILDQFYWAERIRRLKLGPPPVWRTRLTLNNLNKAIHICVNDSAMEQRAKAMGRRIRGREPLLSAMRWLECPEG
jgi:UDP:flavonoid glycosyltransferase YjiC (YdhE family)